MYIIRLRLAARRSLRVVAWNINRGAHLASLAHFLSADPVLAESDVLLLSEVDSGCARSGNRNVARELAAALGMSYAFAPSYLTLADDIGENAGREENTLALAGVAILSRVPMLHAANVDLPELRDKFSSSERRLGRKRALLVDLALQGGPVRVCVCHLDSQASPSQRALQLAALLSRAGDDFPTLIGGDFNTSTCDLSSPGAIVRDVLRKLFVVGADAAVAAFMTPEQGGEEPIFELLARERFAVDALNVRNAPTFAFDLNDPYTIAKTLREAGNVVLWTLRHALRRWNMRVPSRLDWFAGRGVRALDARVIVAPRLPSGIPVTDHAAIVCDVELLARGARDPLAPPP